MEDYLRASKLSQLFMHFFLCNVSKNGQFRSHLYAKKINSTHLYFHQNIYVIYLSVV